MRQNYTEDDFYYGPMSGTSHAPFISGFLNIPTKIYEKNCPQTETEIRINRANLLDIKKCIGKNQKKMHCFYQVKKLCGMEEISLSKETSTNLITTFIAKIPDWKKDSKILQSDCNISAGICYKVRKERGEKINKSGFSKEFGINEKHLNKFLLVNSIKCNSFHKKSSKAPNGTKIQVKKTEDYFEFENCFVPAIDLDENNNRIHHEINSRQEKIIPKSKQNGSEYNPFFGFMICLFYLKFIQECESTHYEYLVKNKSFYKRAAFFIDYDITNFYLQINFLDKYQQEEEMGQSRKIAEQLVTFLIEEYMVFFYKNDDDIDFFTKSYIKKVHLFPLNFIQVIKESGFTPPISI